MTHFGAKGGQWGQHSSIYIIYISPQPACFVAGASVPRDLHFKENFSPRDEGH